MVKKESTSNQDSQQTDIFSNVKYICSSTSLIVDSLRNGLDVAQLPSGDVIVTEVKTVNTCYSWDQVKSRMVKVSKGH